MCCEVNLRAAGEIMREEYIIKRNETNEIGTTLNYSLYIYKKHAKNSIINMAEADLRNFFISALVFNMRCLRMIFF